jgi:hypothetical protein
MVGPKTSMRSWLLTILTSAIIRRDAYENAVNVAGGVIQYTIDALVVDGDMVAADWTGRLSGVPIGRGLSLYRTSGGLLRSTRHTLYETVPS